MAPLPVLPQPESTSPPARPPSARVPVAPGCRLFHDPICEIELSVYPEFNSFVVVVVVKSCLTVYLIGRCGGNGVAVDGSRVAALLDSQSV